MAIRKVTKIINGVSKEVLSLNDILEQIGANTGEPIDFIGLAEVLGIPLTISGGTKNPIILPETFEGQDLTFTAQNATATPTSISFNSVGGTRTISITATGVYRVSSYPEWITMDKTFSRDSYVFSAIAQNNNTINSDSRSGNIVFTGAGSTPLVTVPVTQTGNPITATISPTGTQTLNGSAGTTTITVRLSTSLSITAVILSNTDDFSISEPTTSTSSGITTYTYTLTRYETSTNKSTTLTVGYQGDGLSTTFPAITFNQTGFVPTFNIVETSLTIPIGGDTVSYNIQSNTTWSVTIASTSFAFTHSKQSDRNFTFSALTGTGNDIIYVKAGSNSGNPERKASVTGTTTYGNGVTEATETLNNFVTQTGLPFWSFNDWTGDVSVNGQGEVVVTQGNAKAVSVDPTSFDLVSTDTNREITVTLTVPDTHTTTDGTGQVDDVLTRTQPGLPIFKNSQITLGTTTLFRVSSTGAITAPNVSVPSGITVTLRYTTGNNNTGTAYTTSFPKVSTAVTRYANAVVVVPTGYFNVGSTVTKTVSDTQEVFDPTLSIAVSSLSFVIGGETKYFDVVSNHTWVSVIDGSGFEQSLSSTTGFTTNNLDGSGNDRVYIKALKNDGETRAGSVSVATNFGSLDNSDTVTFLQAGEPTYSFAAWTGVVSIDMFGTVSVTTGNSGTTPTFTPTSFAKVSANTNRTVSVTVTAPDGYNNHTAEFTGNKTVTQPKFVPSISATPASITFASAGGSSYYDVTSNTTWTATISGAGFQHSTSLSSGWKTTAITGTSAGDRIYVRALGHEGIERTGTSTVTTTQGFGDVDDTVDLTQNAAPTFGTGDITITGFDVDEYGTITTPTVSTTANASYTITYTTGNNSGTAYTGAFPHTNSNTLRYCNVTATRPSGYQQSGTTVTKTVSATQEKFPVTWTLNDIPTSGQLGSSAWYVENLKSSQNTAATGTEFFFNIPYTFDYMNNVAGSSFDRSNFGFYVNFGAGLSTTSHRLTSGNKNFTMTAHNNVAVIENSISYDVGERVSIAETTLQRTIVRYMIGTVTAWNQSTKVLSVNVASTAGHIVTNTTTTNYTSWEINQISGNVTSFPRIYTRNDNVTGNDRTTTIKIDDTNDTYAQTTLEKIITQPSQALSGVVNIPAGANSPFATLGDSGVYTNNSASTTFTYFSVGIQTNYEDTFTVTKTGSGGIWISETSNGSAQASITTTSSTLLIAAFYIRYSTGGSAEIKMTDSSGVETILTVNITPQGTTAPPGGKPPLNQL